MLCFDFVLQQTEPCVFRVRGSATHFFSAKRKDDIMEKTYLQQVGERFKECRTRNLFSRRELSERSGVSIDSIKTMERGEKAIGIDEALKICKELDYSMEYILTGNCCLKEIVRLNQKILDLPEINTENLQKIAQAFWSSCPRLFR